MILSLLNAHAAERQPAAPQKVKFEITKPHDGLYVTYKNVAFRSVFVAETLTIETNTFHYKYSTDVVGVGADFKGPVEVKEDSIFLDHPGMVLPSRVAGKLDGRPVILTWAAHQRWLSDGLRPTEGILYLTILSADSPLRRAYRTRSVSKDYPFYTGYVGGDGDSIYFAERDRSKHTTLSVNQPYGVVSEEGKGALFAETLDTELTVKETLEAIERLEAALAKFHGEVTMRTINEILSGVDSPWVHDSEHPEDLISSVCLLEVARRLRLKLATR